VFTVPPPAPLRGRRAFEPVAAAVAAATVPNAEPKAGTGPEAELIGEPESEDADATAEKSEDGKDAESSDVLLADLDED
jgi:hypothetical protein